MPWTRPRIALVACAAVSALAMLYVGLYQIGWLARMACPGFGTACMAVAEAHFAWPLGFADGLLGAALGGLICAVAQINGKRAAAALVVLAAAVLLANFVGVFEMQKMGAYCFWCLLSAMLSVPVVALAALLMRSEGSGSAAPVAPEDPAQQ